MVLFGNMICYKKLFPQEKELIALVDYSNDVIKDSLIVLKAFGQQLHGVRVDTSKNMIDHMFDNEKNRDQYKGVCVEQIKRLRKALDENGGKHVKIIVSSGFTPEKIAHFEASKAPVDAYGVGDYILKINHQSITLKIVLITIFKTLMIFLKMKILKECSNGKKFFIINY